MQRVQYLVKDRGERCGLSFIIQSSILPNSTHMHITTFYTSISSSKHQYNTHSTMLLILPRLSASLRCSFLLLLLIFSTSISCQDFNILDATINDIRRAFTQRTLTSRQLVDFYLDRIQALNPLLRAVIEVNPDAPAQADKADKEREENTEWSSNSSMMHGIPVLLKDSISTKDKLNTSAGSYALVGLVVARDAGVVERLRSAGAVILGKSSMSEWYHFRSMSIPDGWCPRSGQGMVSSMDLN